VRFAYLDESGIGNPKAEPFVVVAGVIVHADAQLKALEKYLSDMANEFVPATLRMGFRFHAKDLFHGNGIFDRQRYPQHLRWEILRHLCEIPEKFDLPVVMGYVERAALLAKNPAATPMELIVNGQAMAATACLFAVERYMRHPERAGEVAALVYENNDQTKKLIRDTQKMLRDDWFTSHLGPDIFAPSWLELLPLRSIVEAPLFAEKSESGALKVADVIAHVLNRKLRNTPECDRFFEPFDRQLIVRAKSFGPPR
jgi:hypothetical protein